MAAERPAEFLDLDDLIDLARLLLGDSPPIRDVGLLASAVARPHTTIRGEGVDSTMWLDAAALLRFVVGNPALVDGRRAGRPAAFMSGATEVCMVGGSSGVAAAAGPAPPVSGRRTG